MGTIMTLCMVLGALFASIEPWLEPDRTGVRPARIGVGAIIALAALWNAGWYAPRHLGEFWGNAALGSGLAMLLVASYLLVPTRLPAWSRRVRPLAILVLAGFGLLYGGAIYRL